MRPKKKKKNIFKKKKLSWKDRLVNKKLALRIELRTNRFAICCATTAPYELNFLKVPFWMLYLWEYDYTNVTHDGWSSCDEHLFVLGGLKREQNCTVNYLRYQWKCVNFVIKLLSE